MAHIKTDVFIDPKNGPNLITLQNEGSKFIETYDVTWMKGAAGAGTLKGYLCGGIHTREYRCSDDVPNSIALHLEG